MSLMRQHESKLLQRACQQGLASPEDLEQLAILRGCHYYDLKGGSETGHIPDIDTAEFSNEELAIALLNPCHRTLLRMRMGAAMIGCQGNDAHRLAQMAVEENCAAEVRHIAHCGHLVETENQFWTALSAPLEAYEYNPENMPHLTRFVEMTGIDRARVGKQMRWIRPVGGPHG